LFSDIISNSGIRLILVAVNHLVLPFNKIFLILPDILSIGFIPFESISLVLNHLSQMRLLCDQIPDLSEIVRELPIFRSLSSCFHMCLDDTLDGHLFSMNSFQVFLAHFLHEFLLFTVELLVNPHICILFDSQYMLHDFRDLSRL